MSNVLLACGGALALAATGCPPTVGGGGGTGGSGTTTSGTAGSTGGGGSGGGSGGGVCPASSPAFDGSEACNPDGLHCDYGQECCNNNCYASYVCDCTAGKWLCIYTDACLGQGGCDSGVDSVDDDMDGYTELDGDCNDCDPKLNPGAAEIFAEADPNDPSGTIPPPVDDDCDGLIDAEDPDLKPCDGALALDSQDPLDAVKAIGMCDVGPNGAPKFLKKATWVLADGTPPGPNVDMAKYHLGHGLTDHFGQSDLPREGARMLVLSSGTARNKEEAGFVSRNFDKGYSSPPPLGFTGESAGCPGVAVDKTSVQDAAGLEMEIQAPSNARGIDFHFSFRTHDFPQFVCTGFDDFFWVDFVQGNVNKDLALGPQGDAFSVNAGLFTQCDCPPSGPGMCSLPGQALSAFDCQGTDLLAGTDFDGATNPMPTYSGWSNAGTGWLRTSAPVQPNEVIKLRFTVFDGGVAQGQPDHNLDSTVTVDRFRWHGVELPSATVQE